MASDVIDSIVALTNKLQQTINEQQARIKQLEDGLSVMTKERDHLNAMLVDIETKEEAQPCPESLPIVQTMSGEDLFNLVKSCSADPDNWLNWLTTDQQAFDLASDKLRITKAIPPMTGSKLRATFKELSTDRSIVSAWEFLANMIWPNSMSQEDRKALLDDEIKVSLNKSHFKVCNFKDHTVTAKLICNDQWELSYAGPLEGILSRTIDSIKKHKPEKKRIPTVESMKDFLKDILLENQVDLYV